MPRKGPDGSFAQHLLRRPGWLHRAGGHCARCDLAIFLLLGIDRSLGAAIETDEPRVRQRQTCAIVNDREEDDHALPSARGTAASRFNDGRWAFRLGVWLGSDGLGRTGRHRAPCAWEAIDEAPPRVAVRWYKAGMPGLIWALLPNESSHLYESGRASWFAPDVLCLGQMGSGAMDSDVLGWHERIRPCGWFDPIRT